MECNKDEAVRARQIAEKKMENNDFEGARKVALKAQNLYPELENITQLLSICDVHCSAQKLMLGSEKDWYGILQVENFADESTVKKQYRRLALFLHPDKNRFPGAESAFKLICEANAVLSDTSKKSLYDSKIRVSVRYAAVNPTPHHMNGNSVFNKQYCPPNNVFNGFSSLNQRQATQSSSSARQDIFCTSCPFCGMKHMFPRKTVNTIQRCHKCRKEFMGIEITAQGVPLGPNWIPQSNQQVPAKPGASQSAGFQAKGIPNQGKFTTGLQNDKGSSGSNMGSYWSASIKSVRPEPSVRTESVYTGVQVGNVTKLSEDLRAKQTEKRNGNSWSGGNKDGTCNGNVKRRQTGDRKNKRKKGRKHVVESSESCDTSSDSDIEDVTIKMDCNPATDLNSGHAHYPRRSSRKRSNVIYNEGGGDDDDHPKSPKRSGGSPEDKENGQNDALGGMYRKHETVEGSHTDADYSKPESEEMESIHSEVGFGDKDGDRDAPIKEYVDCDDPEFYDFDKDRDENCFAVNQFWACYDDVDGMPRFYAKIKKVHTAPFELSFTWLEARPIGFSQNKWIHDGLPVGCGSFMPGKTDKTSERTTFSHQVRCMNKKRYFIINPRKGEVWGLYKDYCDWSRSSNPENHGEYKYEVVEVLSDFVEDTGIEVCYLDKIGGFVSLFQRSEINSFLIWPDEIYRFSHCIPSFKMTGSEREGVPMGSFELDPAALPLNPEDLYYPGKAKMGTENGGPPKSATERGNFVKSENSTLKEFVDLSGDD